MGVTAVATILSLARPETILAASQAHPPAIAQHTADGDRVCANCHREIYERYRSTPMAQASGLATDGLLQGDFHHAASGIDYKVFLRDGSGWMSYSRQGTDRQAALAGERQLRYFIGSNHRGRTYLYEEAGLWFELPINYYSKKALWDMAPNYENSRSMPDGLPIDPNCLYCHATGVQTALPSARNRYSGVPFLQGGIGCSACHGDPTEHLAKAGHGSILNPAHLAAAPRDSVCLQCHLEGDAAIYRAGKSLTAFRPGDDLGAYVTYFVKAGAIGGGGRAASQWEALLRSKCKIASGDKMTCTTCHDPHGSPSEADRVAWFRGKCLACHTGEKMAVEHHPEQQDCAVCHMPTRKTMDISHEQTIDHDIRRMPSTTQLTLSSLGEDRDSLVPVGKSSPGEREFGLAYAQAGERGDKDAREKALHLLASAEAAGADDPELHSRLGLMEQLSGLLPDARREYDRAIAEDPYNNTALGNQAVLLATAGKTAEAIRLLQQVVHNDPSQTSASLNLAFIECRLGKPQTAAEILASLKRFSPDDPALQTFLRSGTYAGQRCDLTSVPQAAPPH
jgi:Flp pilus assembly protein TadD